MTDITLFSGHTIPTLLDRRRDGIYGIAFCPICDQSVETCEQGNGQKHAMTISIAKVHKHMRTRHRIKAGESLQRILAGSG